MTITHFIVIKIYFCILFFTGCRVPSVLLVLEGGPGSLDTVHAAVMGEPPIPVVIIKDGGRAADVLAYAVNIDDIESYVDMETRHENLYFYLSKKFPELDTSEKRERVYSKILKCMSKKDTVCVFLYYIYIYFFVVVAVVVVVIYCF